MRYPNYTDGPWEWGDGWTNGNRGVERHLDYRLLGRNGETILEQEYTDVAVVSDDDRYMIAAAPRMYEALDELVALVRFLDPKEQTALADAVEEASAALSEARGEK